MNSLVYYQPDDIHLLEDSYTKYSVWINKKKCKERFPVNKPIKYINNEIKFPVFVDSFSYTIKKIDIIEEISLYAKMVFDSILENTIIKRYIIVAIYKKDFLNIKDNIKLKNIKSILIDLQNIPDDELIIFEFY